jgi:sec-independent protein translocase protein TatA
MLTIPGVGFTNLGPTELIIILAIILILFGPKSLPSLGRAMGKGLREFRAASSKLSDAINSVDDEDDENAASDAKSRTEPRQIPAPDRERETASVRAPAHSVPNSSPDDNT